MKKKLIYYYDEFICFMLIFFARRFQKLMNRIDKANDGWVWVKDKQFDEIVLYAKNEHYKTVKEFIHHKLK